MSKRGRRRNSKRRKSSSSSKQSVSPYIFQKQTKSNSVGYKDDIVEKGEMDCLRKENALSGSDDEEKYNDTSSKKKKVKQDYYVNSFPNQRNIYTKTTEDTDNGIKIVTSVSVNDVENSSPKIVFQQSREPLSENSTHFSTPVTNIMSINCSTSHVTLEIQGDLQISTSGVMNTFVCINDGNYADMVFNNKCGRTHLLNTESPEQPSLNVSSHNGNQTTNYIFTFGNMSKQTEAHSDSKSVSPIKIWDNPSYSQCCSDDKQQISDFMLGNHQLNINSLWRRNHFDKSFDQFWDIPPPLEFADTKYNSVEDLTMDLASCRIDSCSLADKQQREFHRIPSVNFNKDSGWPFAEEGKHAERAVLLSSFDQLLESDDHEPVPMIPSQSTNKSNFTKDFINYEKRKSTIRNNSIGTVEHRACLLRKKRRQTFPGMNPQLMQENLLQPYSESFASLIMCLLPLQTEWLENDRQYYDWLPAFGIGNSKASQSKESYEPVSEIQNSHYGKQLLHSTLYMTNSEDKPDDLFNVSEQSQKQSSIRYHHKDLRKQEIDSHQNFCKNEESMDTDNCGYKVDQSDIAGGGFDPDMGETEHHSLLAEEFSGRALAIQVIPPSCSGSEEEMLQSDAVVLLQKNKVKHASQENFVSILPQNSRSSVMTYTAGALEQRFLKMDSKLPVEKHFESAMEYPCKFPSQDTNVNSLNTNEVTEEIQRRPFGKNTENISLSLSLMVKNTNLLLDTDGKSTHDSDKPAVAASCPAKCSADSDKEDKQTVSRSFLEAKEHLKPVVHKDLDSSGSDHWAKRRKLFKESKQWSSAGGSSVTSDITEESVSEDTHSMDMTFRDNEDRGFYTETFHSSAWIYQEDGTGIGSGVVPSSINTRTQAVSIRERTVRISKGTGDYPWGFRIQFSKPIVVTEVDTNGAAEEAGLIVGDYVLAVNGTDVTSIPHSEAADLARQGPDLLTLTIGSDIARGPNTPRPACRGYLHKRTQSGLIKGWRRRWFVLTHDCCLYYYRHKRDEGKRRALSAVKLEGAEVGPDTTLGKPFVFKCCPQSNNRVYFFCATSNQEMKRWLEAMEKAIHPSTQNHVWVDVTRHNSYLPPLAVKNPECLGLLHKMDKSKDMWVQHYCILKDGCLLLYSGIRATHAHGGIYLQGYIVREQPYGSKKSTIELKPPSEEFKTFYLCAENPNENKRWIVSIKASIKKWLPLHQALQDYMNRPPEETRM